MKTNHIAALLLAVIPLAGQAEPMDLPQCQPNVLGPQKVQAQSQNASDAQRIAELDQLLLDFRSIRQNLDALKRVPTGFVKNCLDNKKEMVTLNYSKLSPTSQKKAGVLKTMAQILDLNFMPVDAVRFYEAAYELNSSDTESAMRALQLYVGVEFNNFIKNPKAITKDQKLATLKTIVKKGYAISDNPKFSNENRIWALTQIQGALAANEIRAIEAENYWKKLLTLDPNSDLALRELMSLYEKRGDYGKMSVHAARLSASSRVKSEDVAGIGLALSRAEDHSSLLKVGVELTKKFPDNPDAWGYLGMAEHRLKLSERAAEHLEKSIALKNKNPQVVAAYGALLEEVGDRAADDKKWIEAMGKYREALQYNKTSAQLRKKTAYLILDFYTESKFPAHASTKKDMDFALGLLQPSLKSKVPLMADYAAGIRLAAHASNPKQHRGLCDRYQSDRPSGLTLEIVRSCVRIYRAAGSESKAKAVVDLALSKVQDAPTKQEFLETLR